MARYVMDTECYPDYWLLMLKDIDTGSIFHVETYPGANLSLNSLNHSHLYISFNGNKYDLPMIGLALAGASTDDLKRANDDIIVRKIPSWEIASRGVNLQGLNHIDLIEVAPGQCGLKAYGGRLHSKRLQDLPIDPNTVIDPQQRAIIRKYCQNDLATTEDLFRKLEPQIKLRESMSDEYRIDLRSKSDAQMAEAIIVSECQKILGARIYRPDFHPEYRFKYQVPEFVRFQTPGLIQVLGLIRTADFGLTEKGSVQLPNRLDGLRVQIGNSFYKLGIGGLHSCESTVSYKGVIKDRDVASYYPQIILNQNLYPSHIGPAFISVYRTLVDRRIAAKKAGDNVTNESIKVVINGSFGKFGSIWSKLFSPELMIQVTVTGQLALLMLIEALELCGIRVVSANTDGIVFVCSDKAKEVLADQIVHLWEIRSGFTTEETIYAEVYSKDVNNYIAVKPDRTVKQKGEYSFVSSKKTELEKNPNNQVCIDAAIAWLSHGTPVTETITKCTDIRRFVNIRKVEGGAMFGSEYLGKHVRWYYKIGSTAKITYASNSNLVPRSEGCQALMELPDSLPADIDYNWYIKETIDMLKDIGALQK